MTGKETDMKKLIQEPSYSLKDFRLLPGYTQEGCEAHDISLRSPLCRAGGSSIMLDLPFVSAAMQSVTSVQLAIALAELGGVGVIPLGDPIEEQCLKVKYVKHHKAGFQTDIICFSPSHKIMKVQEVIERDGFHTFPVTDNGLFHGRLIGIITNKDFDSRFDLEKPVEERMKTEPQVGIEVNDLKEANRLMIEYGHGFLPVVSAEGTLQSVVFKKDLDKHIKFPCATEDGEKRLRVGAAVSTHSEDRERVKELIETDVDFILIDASDGFTIYQRETIEWIKEKYHVPVVGGNVVTAEAFKMLAEVGADAVKVGMGTGSGCITQVEKATGRGLATSIIEVVKARDAFAASNEYIPIIADGGINTSADIAIALALGADSVMMGNFFARFDESPGKKIMIKGEEVKEYWMEGSTKGHNNRRYQQGSFSFFEEGVQGFVRSEGSLYDSLPVSKKKLISTFRTAGAVNMKDFQRTSVLELQSPMSIRDSKVHDIFQTDIY
jgi:IMP dehydrogenase